MSIACFTISLRNGGLLSSENQSWFDGCDWFKVCLSTVVLYCWCHSDSASVLLYFTLKEKMWLVDSQCGIVGILLNFHMWTGVKNFRPESGVNFFIHEIFHTWNRCDFFIRHVQPCSTCEILNLHTFQTCFWCDNIHNTWIWDSFKWHTISEIKSVLLLSAI